VLQHGNLLQNRTLDRERKRELLLKGANVNWKAFQGPKQRNCNAIDKRVLKILLENFKMAFPLPERQRIHEDYAATSRSQYGLGSTIYAS